MSVPIGINDPAHCVGRIFSGSGLGSLRSQIADVFHDAAHRYCMPNDPSFAEYLERRTAEDDRHAAHPSREPNHHQDQVAGTSIFRGLFKNPFKAVNPSRPVSPNNSRLLASSARKRLKSQVMGH